jgi:hypothetical protein
VWQDKKSLWLVWMQQIVGFCFCFIVFISYHLFTSLRREYIHHCYKECMGRLLCLFVCYGGQKLRRTMDGGGSVYIEEGLRNGRRKVSIRGSMKEKVVVISDMRFLLVLVVLRLLSWLLMNSTAPII